MPYFIERLGHVMGYAAAYLFFISEYESLFTNRWLNERWNDCFKNQIGVEVVFIP
jgi:hypothetical protein